MINTKSPLFSTFLADSNLSYSLSASISNGSAPTAQFLGSVDPARILGHSALGGAIAWASKLDDGFAGAVYLDRSSNSGPCGGEEQKSIIRR